MAEIFPSLNGATYQLPLAARQVLAANMQDASTVEGAALSATIGAQAAIEISTDGSDANLATADVAALAVTNMVVAQDIATQKQSGLSTFTNALMHATTAPCDILFVGDSFIEGVGASSITTSMINRVRDLIRPKYPSGAAGGYGWKAGNGSWSPADDFVTRNIATVNANHGIGLRGFQMSASGQKITIAQPMTSITIAYTQSSTSGVFYYSVDGGSAANVTATGSASEGKKISITGLTAGSHSVEVGWVSGGAVVVEGVMIYNGDENKGIRTWDGGRGSTQTSLWATNTAWLASVTSLVPAPALVVLCLGVNDWAGTGYTPIPSATTKANLKSIIAAIRAATTSNPSIVVVTQFAKQGAGLTNAIEPWSNYEAAIAAVVAEDPTLVPYDMNQRFGPVPAVDSTGKTLVTDYVHPNDAGQWLWADSLVRYLLPA